MELYEKQRRKAETVLPVNIFFLLFVKHQYQNSKREKENKKKGTKLIILTKTEERENGEKKCHDRKY